MKRVLTKIWPVAAAAALVVSACGDGSESIEAAESPLAEFLGEDFDFSSDEAQARFAEEERESQEKIAACMRAEGFEYIPVDNSDFNFAEAEDGLEYDSREYAEKYGFGISTQYFSQEEVGPDLVGHNYGGFDEEGPDDPNQAIVEAMDQSSQEAYYEALYGDEDDFPTFDETMSEEELEAAEEDFVWEPSGCQGEAYSDRYNNNFYQDFEDELEELYKSVENDPRLAEVQQEISECMNDKGVDVGIDSESFERMFEDISTEMNDIENLMGGFPGEDLTEEDFASMTDEELDAMFNQPRNLPDEAKTKLAEIQQREVGMAVAMWDCGGGPEGDISRAYQEIQAEYEQRFLDDNADRLEEYRADA